MAHLASSYSSFETFLNGADAYWTVDFSALNSSGVSATAVLAVNTEDDGSRYLNVAIAGTGMTPDQTHAQHIHGLFDGDGNAIDSVSPTLADDADRDGMVEVLEGVGQYGDVLLPLVSPEGGDMPTADGQGMLSFIQSYDLGDDSNFFSPVTSTDYTAADILPLALREIVLHGVDVPDGIGAGTGGEVDGGTNGYTGILPAAAGEIESVTLAEALDILAGQRATASTTFTLGDGDDSVDAGAGDDVLIGNLGDDMLAGGADNDFVAGNAGDDTVDGGGGMDNVFGGVGHDLVTGGDGDDSMYGVTGSDFLAGNAGNDLIYAGAGWDTVFGGSGNDSLYGVTEDDVIYGVDGDDMIDGGFGDDTLWSGTGDDTALGQEGDDVIHGLGGNDLLVGGAGTDTIYGGAGDDVIGGGGGNDMVQGGTGADEFHFDAGTGTDRITDFAQGEDVISLLDGGAVSFANSTEDAVRGDSDLAAADFAMVAAVAGLGAGNDQQVIYSSGGRADAMSGTGAAVEAYLAATDGTDSYLWYDDDWSDVAGRELVATIDGLGSAMTASDFDVY